MKALHITFSVIIGYSLIGLTQSEHHDIPILSNNSQINNTFTITSFLNFTRLLNIDDEKDQDMDSAETYYDDGAAIMDDYITDEESLLDDDGHHKNATSNDSFDKENDEDSDFSFLATRARWSYAPGFVERICRKECQANGKPFGRLLGVGCQCYCPLNAPDLGLCNTAQACDKFCSTRLGYPKGGHCVYNNICFCYCKKSAPYDVTKVYTE